MSTGCCCCCCCFTPQRLSFSPQQRMEGGDIFMSFLSLMKLGWLVSWLAGLMVHPSIILGLGWLGATYLVPLPYYFIHHSDLSISSLPYCTLLTNQPTNHGDEITGTFNVYSSQFTEFYVTSFSLLILLDCLPWKLGCKKLLTGMFFFFFSDSSPCLPSLPNTSHSNYMLPKFPMFKHKIFRSEYVATLAKSYHSNTLTSFPHTNLTIPHLTIIDYTMTT